MVELWLLRHGATEWARNGRHTGITDLPLLPEGEAEARRLEPELALHTFVAVLVSPLQRAQRTCELAGLGARAQICPDLQEWNYGRYEGITTAEIRRTVADWTIWSHGCPDGESAAAVQARCERVIAQAQQLAQTLAAGPGPGTGPSVSPVSKVALFAHGHILRSLAGTWLGLGAQGGALLTLGTGTISVLGHEREQPAILRWNAPIPGASLAEN